MNIYMCVVILTELLMLAMLLHVLHYTGFTKEQKIWYVLTFLSVMICAASEFAAHCGWFDPAFVPLLTVLTVIQFSLAPLLAVLFSGALGLHHQAKIAAAFFSLNLVVEIIAAPFGLVFRYGPDGYLRGPFFIVYEACYIISLVYLIFSMIRVGKQFRHRDSATIVMILIILVAGIVPMTLYQLHVTYIAIGIGACLCYIYYNDLVQRDIQDDYAANQKKISDMQERIISGLASLIESRDMDTGEHISRTSTYVKNLAEFAREDGVYTEALSDHFISLMVMLAPMHDIGKIIVPDHILKKPGKLTTEEFEVMKKHASAGGAVVQDVLNGITDEETISFASDIVVHHHERWDGTGYPDGLAEENIPLSSRIMAIADVFDALISERCYKKAMTPEEAFRIIEDESGTHFDPKLTRVFLRHKTEFLLEKEA